MSDNKQVAIHQSPEVTFAQMERMAQAVAKSGLFGATTPEQALALMMVAQADGVHPAAAARDYHIIKGRPALKADAMLARFLNAGGKVRWITLTDAEVSAEFSHPSGGTVTISWDDKRVSNAEIKSEMHKKYPRQMKRSRVISEGIRTVFPGVAIGTYTPEEVADMEPEKLVNPRAALDAKVHADIIEEGRTGLSDDVIDKHYQAIIKASPGNELRNAFGHAWQAAKDANDKTSQDFFQKEYDARKAAISASSVTEVVEDAEIGGVL